jgi:hypothetical protein
MHWKRATWVVLALLMATPAIQATPLPPGSTNVIPNSATLDNTTFLATQTLNVTGVDFFGNISFTATVRNEVYRDNATGTLLFLYEVTNSASSQDAIRRLSTTNFAGFEIDVSSTDFAGFTRADRSSNGSVIGFNDFGPNSVDPGSTSAILIIRTNATAYANVGTTALIDGGVGTAISFAPLAIVPEPGTFALAAIGLPLAVGCYRRYRRK